MTAPVCLYFQEVFSWLHNSQRNIFRVISKLLSYWGIDMQNLRCKFCNKRITTHDNRNVQFRDQEESKLNSTINVNKIAHILTHDKIINSSFNKNDVGTIKSK